MISKKQSLIEIADYDHSNYGCDYIKYWENRQYEHQSETFALNKLLPLNEKGGLKKSIVDIGGGYGRLIPTYANRFEKVLIIDTSEKNISQAEIMIKGLKLNNAGTKKGDVYNLPIKSNSFDTALMVRVMHHLRSPERAFSEINRILKPNGVFILEFPNKCHFKAVIKNLFKNNFLFAANLDPYKQPAAGEQGIFFNYHPKHIKKLLSKANFIVEKKISVSNFRSPFIKKYVSINIMLTLEKIAQVLLSSVNFGPSIFLRCRKIS